VGAIGDITVPGSRCEAAAEKGRNMSDAKDNNGDTALKLATTANNAEVVEAAEGERRPLIFNRSATTGFG